MDLDKLDLLNFEEDNVDDLQDLGLGLVEPVPNTAAAVKGAAAAIAAGTVPTAATTPATARPALPTGTSGPSPPVTAASLAGLPATAATTTGVVAAAAAAAASASALFQSSSTTAKSTTTRKRPLSPAPAAQRSRPTTPRNVPAPATTAPPPAAVPTTKVEKKLDTGEDVAAKILDVNRRNGALNKLLRDSASPDLNFALDGDSVLKALVELFEQIIGWDVEKSKVQNELDNVDLPTMADRFTAKAAWTKPITTNASTWAQFCRDTLCRTSVGENESNKLGLKTKRLEPSDVKYLETILVILRNLSYVAANLRLMAYSPDILRVLVGCLYQHPSLPSSTWSSRRPGTGFDESYYASHTMSLTSSAIATLLNLMPYLDVTGDKLFADKLFLKSAMTLPGSTSTEEGPQLPNKETFGQIVDSSWGFGSLIMAKKLDTKEDVVQDVTKDQIVEITEDYLVGVWSIFPALSYVLQNTAASRAITISALELLQEFINQARAGLVGNVEDEEDPDAIPTTRVILVYIPVELLHRLGHFLFIPHSNSDSLDYVDPADNMITRPSPIHLSTGYDSIVDTEIRDKSLSVLVPLLELDSPRMASRLGTKSNIGSDGGNVPNIPLFDAIVPILESTSTRSDAPTMATQLLGELAKSKDNRVACQYLQERIVSIASTNDKVAKLAFNIMYNKEMVN